MLALLTIGCGYALKQVASEATKAYHTCMPWAGRDLSPLTGDLTLTRTPCHVLLDTCT